MMFDLFVGNKAARGLRAELAEFMENREVEKKAATIEYDKTLDKKKSAMAEKHKDFIAGQKLKICPIIGNGMEFLCKADGCAAWHNLDALVASEGFDRRSCYAPLGGFCLKLDQSWGSGQ